MNKQSTKYSNWYASEKTCGLDTKQFYLSLGTNILEVHRETLISRQALSRVPANAASDKIARETLQYLESKITKDYVERVKTLQKNIRKMQMEIDESWEQYLARDEILEKCRNQYRLERKEPLMKRIAFGQVLSNEKNGK